MMRRKQCCGMQRLILLLVVATWLAWFAVLSSTDQRRNRTPAPVRRTEQPLRVASDTNSSRGTPKFLRFSPPNTVVDWSTFEPDSPWASWRLWSSTNPFELRRNVRLNVQAKAIVLQFPNRSVFTSIVEDGLLVPSQRFGFDGKLFIGYRHWVHSNGDSHSTEEECAHIALTTACAVGFRVLTFEEHNPHSSLCEILFPVVNKDMPGDYNDSKSTSGVLSGFDQVYAPSAAEAELFLFLYGAALAEEENYMVVPRLDVLVAPAQQHVYLPVPSHQRVIEVAIDFVVSVGEARFTLSEKDAGPTAVAVDMINEDHRDTANVSSCRHRNSTAILDVMFKSESGQRVVRASINHRCRITLQFPTPHLHIVGLVQWKVSAAALVVTVTPRIVPFSLTLELDPPATPVVDVICAALIDPRTERCIRNLHVAFRRTEEEEEHSQQLPSFFHNQMVS
ncbi:membrane-associated protein, putative, partial [Bodo saltans]